MAQVQTNQCLCTCAGCDYHTGDGGYILELVPADGRAIEHLGQAALAERFPTADAWQVSATGQKDYVAPNGVRVAPALELLHTLV